MPSYVPAPRHSLQAQGQPTPANGTHTHIVERQNGKRGLESGFGSAGYANGIWVQILEEDGMVHKFWYLVMSECGA